MTTTYGVRNYTCSEKTKRPQKKQVDQIKLEKRNTQQRRLYVSLENIDEIFSNNNDKYPVCYDLIFNTIQGKVTKYFNGRSYDRKKELSYDCMNVLYSSLKRKLLRLNDEKQESDCAIPPVLFFYLSQFFRYIDCVVFSVVYYGARDLKYIVQEPENFNTDDVLRDNSFYLDDYINAYVNENENENEINDDENIIDKNDLDFIFEDNSDNIKICIEANKYLSDKEKKVLLKIYKNSYSSFGRNSLSKRDSEILLSIQNRLKEEPELLKDLEEILDAE